MANLTLAIDDDLLQRAQQAALIENTSVNALVRDTWVPMWMRAAAAVPLHGVVRHCMSLDRQQPAFPCCTLW